VCRADLPRLRRQAEARAVLGPAQTKDVQLVDQENSSRVAVVTGSGTSIGAAVAQWFATDRYTVVLVGSTEATLRQTVREGPDGLFAARVLDNHLPPSTGSGREPT
jgi:predicted amino acid dehydrogenase